MKLFLVTANVGSVFENMDAGLELWMDEFSSVIRSKQPELLALHFQETGGKCYENGSSCISRFFGELINRMKGLKFVRGLGFVDSRSDLEHQFTALSSLYFVHESIPTNSIAIWDFQAKVYQPLSTSGFILHAGAELDKVSTALKEKFPQNFYPNCKWSRKGFLKVRFFVNGQPQPLEFVNIHLFHDADNLVAASVNPSEFATSRKKTMEYTLQRLESSEKIPRFIFGDFNFRLDTAGVVAELKSDLVELSSKKFSVCNHEHHFKHSWAWARKWDVEVNGLKEYLSEEVVTFHPTYPFEEELGEGEKFLRTRCPAWCDRVLYNQEAKDLLRRKNCSTEYNLIGSKVCMGDHKPVYLSFDLLTPIPTPTSPTGKSKGSPLSAEYRMTLTPRPKNLDSVETTTQPKPFFLFRLFSSKSSSKPYKKSSLASASDSSDEVKLRSRSKGLFSRTKKPKAPKVCGKFVEVEEEISSGVEGSVASHQIILPYDKSHSKKFSSFEKSKSDKIVQNRRITSLKLCCF